MAVATCDLDPKENFMWSNSRVEVHCQRCPLKTLLNCVSKIDDVADIYFDCKLCYLTADLHKGEENYVDHLRTHHPLHYLPPPEFKAKVGKARSIPKRDGSVALGLEDSSVRPESLTDITKQRDTTETVPKKLEEEDESGVQNVVDKDTPHEVDDGDKYGGVTDEGEPSDAEPDTRKVPSGLILKEELGDPPTQADVVQLVSEDRSQAVPSQLPGKTDEEHVKPNEKQTTRTRRTGRRTGSDCQTALPKKKGKKRGRPRGRYKTVRSMKRKKDDVTDDEVRKGRPRGRYKTVRSVKRKRDDVTDDECVPEQHEDTANDCVTCKPEKKKRGRKKKAASNDDSHVASDTAPVSDVTNPERHGCRDAVVSELGSAGEEAREEAGSSSSTDRPPKPKGYSKRIASLALRYSRRRYGKGRFFCSDCDNSFATKRRLVDHQLKQHQKEKPEFACNICKKKYTKFNSLDYHKKTHSDNRPRCQVCMRLTLDELQVEYHRRIHAGLDPYACSKCDRTFKYRTSWNTHQLIHAEEVVRAGRRDFLCNVCGKALKSKAVLLRHEAAHNKVKAFKCPSCPLSFYFEYRLTQHIGVAHSGRKFCCEFCGKVCRNSSALHEHRRTHTGESPYACDQCPMKFKTKGNLTKHKTTHSDNLFTCTLCEKTYKTVKSYTVHMSIHRGVHPYQCAHCGKSYTTKARLDSHVHKQHSDEGYEFPYECSICERKYADKKDFDVHVLRHEGKNPFFCPLCSKSVSRLSYLKVHLRKYHPGDSPDISNFEKTDHGLGVYKKVPSSNGAGQDEVGDSTAVEQNCVPAHSRENQSNCVQTDHGLGVYKKVPSPNGVGQNQVRDSTAGEQNCASTQSLDNPSNCVKTFEEL